MNDQFPISFFSLVQVHLKLHAMTQSEKVLNYRSLLQKTLEQNPNDEKALIHLGALEFEYFHEHEKAISLLEKVLAINPKNVDAMFWLAMCYYYDYCEYDKSEKMLRKAISIAPDRADCLSLLAWVFGDLNKPLSEVIAYTQQALKFAPDWPMLRVQLATFLFEDGKIDEADQEMQKAHNFKKFPAEKVTNEVQRYYESVVTGRIWDKEELKTSHIAQRIQKAKMEKK